MEAPSRSPVPVVAIGASTGGPRAVASVLAGLPGDFPAAVVVVQHLDHSFSSNMAGWLSGQTSLPVALAAPGDRLEPGRVYVAKGGDHLSLGGGGSLRYGSQPAKAPYRPSIDVLFESLAASGARPGAGVLLTGMGSDGANGLLALRRAGWLTIAQDRETSAVYGMPGAALELGAAELILPLGHIAWVLLDRLAPRP